MPRKAATPKVPKPKPLFSRPEVIGLCKRFLRPDEFEAKYYDPIKSVMTMYGLIKKYPSRTFWLNYELGFTLRSLFWFLGVDGRERLARDWSIFSLDLGPQVVQTVGTEKVGEDAQIERPKTTVADLFR